jgi:hypothetical protein
VAALLTWSLIHGRSTSEAVDRALAAEAAVATLRPLADSLRREAERRDTVLVTVLDSIEVVVERVRVVQVEAVDSLRARLDSAEVVFLNELVAAHAVEVAALEESARQALLWGQGWRDAADAMTASRDAEIALGAAWEASYRAQARRGRLERGVLAAVVLGVLLLR